MTTFLKIAFLLLPILGFSYKINFSKSFQKTIEPDLLTTNISISIENKDENKVNKRIQIFNDFIKNTNLVKIRKGTYSLSPKYNYYKNKQEFIGYNGYLNYTIESKKAKPLNTFISKLIDLKDTRYKVNLDISNITWIISEKERNKNFDELRLETIKWINTYSNNLSKDLSKSCKIKTINIGNSNSSMPTYRNEISFARKMKTQADVTPIKSEQNITIYPSFTLECK